MGAGWRALPRPRRLRTQPDSGASACLCPRPQEASDGDGAVANCGPGPWGQYEASQQDGPSFRVLPRKRTPPKALSSGGAEFPSMGALRACPPSRAAPAPQSLPPGPLPRAGCGVGLVELLPGAQGLGRHPGQVLGAAGELGAQSPWLGPGLGGRGRAAPPGRGRRLSGGSWRPSMLLGKRPPLPWGVSSISFEDLALDLGLARAIQDDLIRGALASLCLQRPFSQTWPHHRFWRTQIWGHHSAPHGQAHRRIQT